MIKRLCLVLLIAGGIVFVPYFIGLEIYKSAFVYDEIWKPVTNHFQVWLIGFMATFLFSMFVAFIIAVTTD